MVSYMAHRSRDLIITYLHHPTETNRIISSEVHWEVHWWTMVLHRAAILQQCFAQVIFLRRKLLSSKDSLQITIFLLIFEGRVSHEVFSCFLSCIKQHFLLSFRLYLGDIWSCYQGPQLSKLGFRGGVRIINPLLIKLYIRLIYPNLEVLIN